MSDATQGHKEQLARIERALDAALPASLSPAADLVEAMRYALLGGGKRVRALLVLLTGDLLKVDPDRLLPAACAVEFIHAYSLIHDDLPAMDDDDLRRGRASTHIAHGEATAILAGDALQTRAFELLADAPEMDATVRLAQVGRLACAAGATGMVGGQALDMAAEGKTITRAELEQIHRLKTGALLEASVMLAADAAPQLDDSECDALAQFAACLGLAYQVRDDLLDVQTDTATLGKPQGSDQDRGKSTYVSLMGAVAAADYCDALHQRAAEALKRAPGDPAALLSLSAELLKRKF